MIFETFSKVDQRKLLLYRSAYNVMNPRKQACQGRFIWGTSFTLSTRNCLRSSLREICAKFWTYWGNMGMITVAVKLFSSFLSNLFSRLSLKTQLKICVLCSGGNRIFYIYTGNSLIDFLRPTTQSAFPRF